MRYLILFSLIANLGCVSLNEVYNNKHHKREIKEFCKSVSIDYKLATSKTSMGDCIVKASIVQRQHKYEKLLWWIVGTYFTLDIICFIIEVSLR